MFLCQGGLHPAARRHGVLAGPNQPPARPHCLPTPAGRLGPPGRHDAPGRGRMGLRAFRPVRLPASPDAFARSGMSPVPNLSPVLPWGTGLASLCPALGDALGALAGTLLQPQRPSSPFASPWGMGGSQRPPQCRWWLINHVNGCGGTKKDPSEAPARALLLPPLVPGVLARTVQRAIIVASTSPVCAITYLIAVLTSPPCQRCWWLAVCVATGAPRLPGAVGPRPSACLFGGELGWRRSLSSPHSCMSELGKNKSRSLWSRAVGLG